MKEYIIEYYNDNNKIIKKTIKANSIKSAEEYCRKNNLLIKNIKESNNIISNLLKLIPKISLFNNTNDLYLKDEEILEFLNALLISNESDMLPNEKYEYMKEILTSKKMSFVVEKFNQDIINGIELSQAMKNVQMPDYISYSIKVGSESGDVNNIYKQIITMLKRKLDTKKRINKLLLTPKITLFFLYSLFLFFIYYYFQETKSLMSFLKYEDFPDISKLFFIMSDYATDNKIIFFILSATALIFVYKTIYFIISKIIKYVPGINKVYKYEDIITIFSLLTVSTASNILLFKGIQFSAAAIKDKKLKIELENISENIEVGGALFSEETKKKELFDTVINIFIKNAEKTTRYSYYFNLLVKQYSQKLDDTIEFTSNFINPLMLIISATLILSMYYAANAPMLTFDV